MLITLKRRRRGFTLMEIALVLAIMVAVAAMAIPVYHGTLKRERVRKAAESIGADWTRARAAAIQTGETQLWACTLAAGTFSSGPYLANGGATNAEVANMVSQSTGMTVSMPAGKAGEGFGQALPQGVTLGDVLVSEGDTSVNMSVATNSGEAGTATLLFYPDGSSSSARITVIGEDDITMAVAINGLAGTVRVMRVESNQ